MTIINRDTPGLVEKDDFYFLDGDIFSSDGVDIDLVAGAKKALSVSGRIVSTGGISSSVSLSALSIVISGEDGILSVNGKLDVEDSVSVRGNILARDIRVGQKLLSSGEILSYGDIIAGSSIRSEEAIRSGGDICSESINSGSSILCEGDLVSKSCVSTWDTSVTGDMNSDYIEAGGSLSVGGNLTSKDHVLCTEGIVCGGSFSGGTVETTLIDVGKEMSVSVLDVTRKAIIGKTLTAEEIIGAGEIVQNAGKKDKGSKKPSPGMMS